MGPIYGEVVVLFDKSYPITDRDKVLRYHNKVTRILEEITGISPNNTFVIVYNPSSHLGFRDNRSMLIDSVLPSKNPNFWYWWYLVEVAHFYVPDINIWKNNATLVERYKPYFNPYMSIREHEYISHALAEYVIVNYLRDSQEFKDNIQLYINQKEAWLSPITLAAIKTISPQTIFQVDTNYSGFNSFACSVAGSLYFKLLSIDKDFLKKFFRKLRSEKVTTIEQIIGLIEESIRGNKIDGIDKFEWLKTHPYFARFDDRNLTYYSLDIIGFERERDKTYPWHRITYINPSYFIITGSSNKYYDPSGYPASQIDKEFFGQDVTFTIVDEKGRVVFSGVSKISPNLWENYIHIPNLPIGKYEMEARFKDLKDRLVFYVRDHNNLYDDENGFLVIDDLRVGDSYYDVVSLYDNGVFRILDVKGDPNWVQENGVVRSLEDIRIKNILVLDNLYNVIMGYNNGTLYVKGLY